MHDQMTDEKMVWRLGWLGCRIADDPHDQLPIFFEDTDGTLTTGDRYTFDITTSERPRCLRVISRRPLHPAGTVEASAELWNLYFGSLTFIFCLVSRV